MEVHPKNMSDNQIIDYSKLCAELNTHLKILGNLRGLSVSHYMLQAIELNSYSGWYDDNQKYSKDDLIASVRRIVYIYTRNVDIRKHICLVGLVPTTVKICGTPILYFEMYTFALIDDILKGTPLHIKDYIVAPERIIPVKVYGHFLKNYCSIPSDTSELLKYIVKPHPVWLPFLCASSSDTNNYFIFRKFLVVDGYALMGK
jgi:hypothetical protein